ncbi:hypothetical protein ESA94_08135 [Lacibacter luteus]|uniref:ZU5 domain-containing protein n=1 Tax=Lacibacter luteus TaxID=2508719 RepID=A0A4Q1CJ99_9BACT|nr:hypothetical protein [Lacibacter luteus]RXK60428.1 hypothetical protein ESA94_08135 [Lacibacter luteus]
MKIISTLIIACLLTIMQTGCSKKPSDIQEPAETPGEVTAVGTADEVNAATKIIGAAGGTINSNDGKISVSIPQGALTTNQTITVQRITNTNPMGINKGYRITPHNLEFAKPATITFKYTETDFEAAVPEALGIAYQTNEGVWNAINSTTLNKNLMIVSVETTHFSDWTFFKSFELTSTATVLPTKGIAQLELLSDANFLLHSLEKPERPIGKRQNMTALFIKGWSLAGAGNLAPNQQKATYTAPATVPNAPNPVAISVNIDLNKKGKFLVVKHIKISNDGEISVRVGGGDWFTQEASPVVKISDNYYMLADSDGDEKGRYISVRWQGAGTGTFAYKQPDINVGTHVQYLITGGANYNCAYTKPNDEFVASGGGVTITSLGNNDGYVTGTFIITPSGSGDFLRAGPTVEGKFRVRKSW